MKSLFKNYSFIFLSALLFLVFYSLQRVGIFFHNSELATNIPSNSIAAGFFNGVRFDLLIVGYFFLPIILGLFVFRGLRYRKFMMIWLTTFFIITGFLGVLEYEFFHEFHARLNSMVFEYIKEDPKTVTSMIVNGFPIVRYLVIFFISLTIFIIALRFINKKTQNNETTFFPIHIAGVFVLLLVFVLAARGTTRSGPPLRWGDAYTTGHLFTNQLGLNGSYTLLKAATNYNDKKSNKKWLSIYPKNEAIQLTKQMLQGNTEYIDNENTGPFLRTESPTDKYKGKIKNIVIVMMESFSGMYTGALGHGEKDITPYFDKIAKDGLLFTQFFSNGTHTHQGMFATLGSFPNLPGYEYLMQREEGGQLFSGLASVLNSQNIKNNAYVYNGDFSWDNQRGFFSSQGMTNFIGRFDYENPIFIDPTWGVSDQDMFDRSIVELDKLSSKKEPFYAVLQTLSNHVPFKLPDPLPVDKVDINGKYSERLTAMRYADWAVGQFYKDIKNKPYFNETAFVFIGDHGFGNNIQTTDMDLSRFYIPMLIIAPEIQETYGKTNNITGSQVDIVPTITALLKRPFSHQSWGRDLLSLNTGNSKSDLGFAVIKPSGSDPTIAIIEGTTIAVSPENVEATLWNFDLNNQTGERLEITNPNNKNKLDAMQKRKFSYIQSAMNTLVDDKTANN